MPKQTSDSSSLKVLVVDDDANWVQTLVAVFEQRSIKAEGISQPADLFKWTTPGRFATFDMIFLDMRLGPSKGGGAISAADVVLHIMTYCPNAKVVIFTQEEVTVEECVRCIQLGALGFIPKGGLDIDEIVLVAKVYGQLGDERRAMEERISSLSRKLEVPGDPAKGRHLEMLTTNLFNSMLGFKVVANNSSIIQGELDLVVENQCDHQFWQNLSSFHLVVECKNEKTPMEKKAFNILYQKVKGKDMCKAGILVSWSGFSRGFRDMQSAEAPTFKIYRLEQSDLRELIRKGADEREAYLRAVLEVQF